LRKKSAFSSCVFIFTAIILKSAMDFNGDNGLPEAMDGVALDSNEEAVSLQPPVGTPSSTAVAATAEPMEELTDEATTTTEAYEPEYDNEFPELKPTTTTTTALPELANGAETSDAPSWRRKMAVRSTMVTQLFHLPVEERRYRDASSGFGDTDQQARVCTEIMRKCGVAIEINSAKDQSLTLMITGKIENVLQARKEITAQLQTQCNISLAIPQEHHRFILGKGGKNLTDLENKTSTKIQLPRPDMNSDEIKISGTKENVEKAKHEIQLISDEQSKLAFERLNIEKIYHPFVCGPWNRIKNELVEKYNVRINVPPPSVNRDEITVAGDKEGVMASVQVLNEIYEEKKSKCQMVSIEVRKTQHKYIIGQQANNLYEILDKTGVSVEVPFLESSSETITLRGEQLSLGSALTLVYEKANSVVIQEINVPAWMHRFIIGKKGANVRAISTDLPKVQIDFRVGEDKIVVEGPPEEVGRAAERLETLHKETSSNLASVEIDCDPKFHRHIIGKSGANIGRIKEETLVDIKIPQENANGSNKIRIEGPKEGVLKAQEMLQEMVATMENEITKEINIEHRFHRTMIGTKGEKIREIRDQYNQVQITFPDASKQSNTVTVRGPREDVNAVVAYLTNFNKELVENNYQEKVPILKKFHKNVIGKGGVNVRKIKEETDTRIDLPSEATESELIIITGKKANVEKAKQMILAIQKELVNVKEDVILIPSRFHNSIIGAKGKLIRSIMEDCGGVTISFPPEGSNSDKVTIRGVADDVAKAKKQLTDLASERQINGYCEELKADTKFHKFLIGRKGGNIAKIREQHNVRVVFPGPQEKDQEVITIIGKEEDTKRALGELKAIIEELMAVDQINFDVDQKYHRHFVARRGQILKDLAEEFGGVMVSFPRPGIDSTLVTIKGPKECVYGAKARILEMVAELDAQVTVNCVIPQKFHRIIMGPKGSKVQSITEEFGVQIKFPDRVDPEAVANGVNNNDAAKGEDGGDGEPAAVESAITITGPQEKCDAAYAALMALVPITDTVQVPFEFHRNIIGRKGETVRNMMNVYNVNIMVPPSGDKNDLITITGPPANVEKAKAGLLESVAGFNKEKEDRIAKNQQVTLSVPPKYHPKIIGRQGAIINQIRKVHNVMIQFPNKGAEDQDIITITGYMKDAEAAKAEIQKKVDELEAMTEITVEIDSRIHPRIIGGRGRNVKQIMTDFKVDIRFGAPDADGQQNRNLVVISGKEEDCLDCRDHLLNMEEEFLQDIADEAYLKPPSRQGAEGFSRPSPQEYVVKNAPWNRDSSPSTASAGGDAAAAKQENGAQHDGDEAPAPKAKPKAKGNKAAPVGKPLDLTSNEDFPTFVGKRSAGPAPVEGNKPAATWVRPSKK